MAPDEKLRQYATEAEWLAYTAYCESGSFILAGRQLGKDRTTIRNQVRKVQERALRAGEAPVDFSVYKVSQSTDGDGNVTATHVKVRAATTDLEKLDYVPDPKKITGTSTLFAGDRSVTQQWVRERADDKEREKLWLAFAEGLAGDLPRTPAMCPPEVTVGNLLTHYAIGDHHLGQLSWGLETGGDNYDVKISEQLLADATGYLVASAPPSEEAIVGFLGDFTHTDGYAAMTPASGHLLDADVRFPKIAMAAARAMRNTIDLALAKHKHVRVVVTAGNHDPVSTIWLRIALAAVYEREPRVTIDGSPSKFGYYEWGKCLFGWTHGDRIKIANLPAIMATDQAEAWGRTLHRFWYTGHVHHDQVKDLVGAKVESLRVLAPNDAYAAKGGYRTPRDMKAIVYHREFGETGRLIAPAAMFRREAV